MVHALVTWLGVSGLIFSLCRSVQLLVERWTRKQDARERREEDRLFARIQAGLNGVVIPGLEPTLPRAPTHPRLVSGPDFTYGPEVDDAYRRMVARNRDKWRGEPKVVALPRALGPQWRSE